MEIHIKPITEETFDEFFTLFAHLVHTQFPEYTHATKESILSNPRGGWTKEAFKKNLQNEYYTLLGAWHNDKIVGMLDAWYQVGGVCFLSWLMVDPSVQKKGVGKKLVQELEKEAKEKGFHQIFLYADHRNIPFYEDKLGYTNSGLMKKSWYNTDNYIFTKNIQKAREENYIK